MHRRTRWIIAAAAAVVLVVCALGWGMLREEPGDASAPVADPPVAAVSAPTVPAPAVTPLRGPCDRAADLPFTPERITIDGVADGAAVVGVPRDDRGVTGVLPISNRTEFAWDLGGIRPGSRRGNVLLNTHTWPDGSAVGNRMLAELHEGDWVVVEGLGGARLCYRVDRRIEVLAADGYPPYYDEDGPHRLAFIVCSGSRDRAGEWSHRTIWFARRVSS